MTDSKLPDETRDGEPMEWYDLRCPMCGNDCFDGQGYDGEGRYIHRCPDCNTTVHTPQKIDGKVVGTK